MSIRRSSSVFLLVITAFLGLYVYFYILLGKKNWSTKHKSLPDRSLCFYNDTADNMRWNLPNVPKHSLQNDTVELLSLEVMRHFTWLNKTLCQGFLVLILTPIQNSEDDLERYLNLIKSLDYPRHLLSVSFGEDGSQDKTFAKALIVAEQLKALGIRRVDVHHFNITGQVRRSWANEHSYAKQLQRRSHLAKARNLLLDAALKDEDYVLWLDSDIKTVPLDLIQQMLHANKDLVSASCLFKDRSGRLRIYDKNTWRETVESLQKQERFPKNQLVVEGYGPSLKIYLPHLRGEGKRAVPIDGVGGCSLLVKADCHRNKLRFPETLYKRHIETEGMAKMAKDMGYSVYGLPFVNVFHS
ncbi:uncharacterized protein LOC134265496 [Saccostrea cucullata]|uniref:uncharacterized protein LOC134265496 n=1 Tax=Saccostrea cuccullata TaxID=36930 RepID=UPI002ED4D808